MKNVEANGVTLTTNAQNGLKSTHNGFNFDDPLASGVLPPVVHRFDCPLVEAIRIVVSHTRFEDSGLRSF